MAGHMRGLREMNTRATSELIIDPLIGFLVVEPAYPDSSPRLSTDALAFS